MSKSKYGDGGALQYASEELKKDWWCFRICLGGIVNLLVYISTLWYFDSVAEGKGYCSRLMCAIFGGADINSHLTPHLKCSGDKK